MIQVTAKDYVVGIVFRLRKHEYDPKLIEQYIVGGGGYLIKNFGQFEVSQVVINEDVWAIIKGYEYPTHLRARRGSAVCAGKSSAQISALIWRRGRTEWRENISSNVISGSPALTAER